MTTWLREPLVHFLAVGAILFAIGAAVGPPDDPTSREVVITAGEIDRLAATFEASWQRPPTGSELKALVDDWTTEELLYREAIAMGLDKDDDVVRRRMRQKLSFLAVELAGTAEPTEDELAAWLAAHPEDYRRDAVFDMAQIFLGADPEGRRAPLHVPSELRDVSATAVAATFGSDFERALHELPVGEWSGPVASGFGLHRVRVDRRVAGEVPPLDEIREIVRRDVVAERTRRAEQSFHDALRERYEVTVEWPSP
jgi:hypothetical protein